MKFKALLILIIASLVFFSGVGLALAFGISPPLISNDYLVPGSHFEQTITLTQAEPKQPTNIETLIDAPEIEDWIQIQPGRDFTIPAGRQQFPMRVRINVPPDAGYGVYEGTITVRAISGGGEGAINIITGAVADIKLKVTGEEFSDFRLRGLNVPNIEEGSPIKAVLNIENLGNVKIRPSKVYIRIFDKYHNKLLESGEAAGMDWVEPFDTEKITAKLPTELGVGEYWAEIEIYKRGGLLAKDKRYFHIVEKGTLGEFLGLAWWIWILILAVIIALGLSIKFKLWKKLLAKFGISIKLEKTKK